MTARNSASDRNRKLEALGILMALFPPHDVGATEQLLRAHLECATDIPAPVFAEAARRLAKTWRYRNTPNPGDIRDAADQVVREQRRLERQVRRVRRCHEAEGELLTPAQARAELARIEADPMPEKPWERVATSLYVAGLRGCVARAEVPELEAGDVSDEDVLQELTGLEHAD